MKCLNTQEFTVCAITTVKCVSSRVSQIRALASRGTEQSEPTQLSEHTHMPRDYNKENI